MPDSFVDVELKISVYRQKLPILEGSSDEDCSDHQPEKGLQALRSDSSFAEIRIDHPTGKGLQFPESRSFLATVWPKYNTYIISILNDQMVTALSDVSKT